MTQEPIYITWLTHLPGFHYFLFTAKNEYHVDVDASGETRQNIFTQWPKSYGETADTIDKTTFRDTRDAIVLKTQHLTKNQAEALSYIKSSTLVQIMVTSTDRRTVLVDTDSFMKWNESEDLYALQFRIRFTNQRPAQRL